MHRLFSFHLELLGKKIKRGTVSPLLRTAEHSTDDLLTSNWTPTWPQLDVMKVHRHPYG